MIDNIIQWSLSNRLLVIVFSAFVVIWGSVEASNMPIDVFPDLTAPTVTVVTEAHGLTPDDVERMIATPIESSLNGATKVRRVRSVIAEGIAIVKVDFDWGVPLLSARQVVSERLQLASPLLPEEADTPIIGPMTSVMGEILFLGLTTEREDIDRMELGSIAKWNVARRLLSVPGVAQVMPLGGDTKQYQVRLNPYKLNALGLRAEDVAGALEQASENMPAGFMREGGTEKLIVGIGRIQTVDDIANSYITTRGETPILVKDVAQVHIGPAIRRGDGGINQRPGVVIGIRKQPNVNTLALTTDLERALVQINQGLPEGVVLHTDLFRQADFISLAIKNVTAALRDGSILVVIIVLLFLMSGRATLITALAIPISLLTTIVVMKLQGIGLNTMTLGGMAISVGALVDDAIIDVENVVRRMRENRGLPTEDQKSNMRVVLEASREIRRSIVFATGIIILVFVPLFFLSGIEGRLLQPLGIAYMISLTVSLIVALTITPVLCFLFLPNAKVVQEGLETNLVRWLRETYRALLRRTIHRWDWMLGISVVLFAIALASLLSAGRSFLPPFNEGALTIGVVSPSGTSLAESATLGTRVEKILLRHPEVMSTARRTGRGEGDDHAQSISSSEIDVRLREGSRSQEAFLQDLREDLASVKGCSVIIGQPMGHRIDHMLSGTRANIAVKIFGDDIVLMRRVAEDIKAQMQGVSGVVDLSVEQQQLMPFVSVAFDRSLLARHGLKMHEIVDEVSTFLQGRAVSTIYEGNIPYDLVLRYEREGTDSMDALKSIQVATASGARVPLQSLAKIHYDFGPNVISRENVRRKLVVMANVAGRDVVSVVEEIQERVVKNVEIPSGYYIDYGGQFESANRASKTLLIVGLMVLLGIFILLFVALERVRDALLVLLNLPLALIGGVVGVYFVGGVISVAVLIGFIALFGIATRNGIMLVTHIQNLWREQLVEDHTEAVLRGAEERLSPILMTALASGFGLFPLALALGEPGSEIQAPMALVILCGLGSSTMLNMFVLPSLYIHFGDWTDETHTIATKEVF